MSLADNLDVDKVFLQHGHFLGGYVSEPADVLLEKLRRDGFERHGHFAHHLRLFGPGYQEFGPLLPFPVRRFLGGKDALGADEQVHQSGHSEFVQDYEVQGDLPHVAQRGAAIVLLPHYFY